MEGRDVCSMKPSFTGISVDWKGSLDTASESIPVAEMGHLHSKSSVEKSLEAFLWTITLYDLMTPCSW